MIELSFIPTMNTGTRLTVICDREFAHALRNLQCEFIDKVTGFFDTFETKEDMPTLTVSQLMHFENSKFVSGIPINQAVWSYLWHLPQDWPIVIYWGKEYNKQDTLETYRNN